MAQKQIIINTLEDIDNPYRAIFEVKKLDEGWDVLNLFDIVRLYETRDGKNGKPGTKTIQEAQLIGRGARYCPFKIQNEQDKYTRKFDNIDDPMKICEELYYHCQYDSRYISELKIALIETGILPEKIIERQYKVKDEFKQTELYKTGLVFKNEKKLKERTDVFELPSGLCPPLYEYQDYTGKSTLDTILSEKVIHLEDRKNTKTVTFKIKEIADKNYSLIHSAMRRFDEFKFNALKSKFPNLTSSKEFITSDSYIGNIRISITSLEDEINAKTLFKASLYTLGKIADKISTIEESYYGTKEFVPKRFHEVFKDKPINIYDPHDEGHGVSQNADTVSIGLKLDLSKENWYIFNDNYGTSEEKAFVKYFKNNIPMLENEYDAVYLVRNERQLEIYSFDNGERFEPDYLLFLQKKGNMGIMQYQIFIEPKGSHLIEKDGWKQKLLLSLKEEAIPVKKFVDDNEYFIWGFPFYNQETMDEVVVAIDGLTNI